MLKNIKAVLFDLDGTLVDSMWMWKDIDVEYLGRFGKELPPALQKEIEGMSYTETAHYFKETFQLSDSIEKIKQDWNEMAYHKYCHEVFLKKGARTFLDNLKARGIKMGIATSNSIELVKEVLKSNKIEHYFDQVCTACEVKRGKPAPDIYLKVARDIGAAPEECLVFEDIPNGIQAGLNAGMKVCGVRDEFSMDQEAEKRELSHYYIRDFDEVAV